MNKPVIPKYNSKSGKRKAVWAVDGEGDIIFLGQTFGTQTDEPYVDYEEKYNVLKEAYKELQQECNFDRNFARMDKLERENRELRDKLMAILEVIRGV